MSIKMATLSSSGWSNSLQETLDRKLSYLFLTDIEQSQFINPASIASISAIIQKNVGDIPGLIEQATNVIENYFKGTFDSVVVSVITKDYSEQEPEKINLVINIGIGHQGDVAKLVRGFSTYNGKLKKIISYNNTGE